ncbi:MAG: FAD-binding domain-containing protein [Erythrobacter sp.]
MQFSPTRTAGLDRLHSFLPGAGRLYAEQRNHDEGSAAGADGWRRNVSQLSPWLHAGMISETEVLNAVLSQHSAKAAEKFIAEVFWRIYFKGYLEQRPSVWASYCTGRDEALAALAGNSGLRTAYEQATGGRTGIAAFDHWAQELVETGYLHNHARMWFASIWIFTLRLDWHLGADFFLQHLVDGDAASNTLSWRWVGGLHTKGKNYLARADNIVRYTARHPHGPLDAQGLAEDAEPLAEAQDHPRGRLDLPAPPAAADLAEPFALLLHDEAAHHAPLDLASTPALVIGASQPEARSPQGAGGKAKAFAQGAMAAGMAEASTAFACPSVALGPDASLADALAEHGIKRVAVPYLPAGWVRDSLRAQLAPLADEGRIVTLLPDLSRATWPHAKAGFFGVAKQIDAVLGECGITGEALRPAG